MCANVYYTEMSPEERARWEKYAAEWRSRMEAKAMRLAAKADAKAAAAAQAALEPKPEPVLAVEEAERIMQDTKQAVRGTLSAYSQEPFDRPVVGRCPDGSERRLYEPCRRPGPRPTYVYDDQGRRVGVTIG